MMRVTAWAVAGTLLINLVLGLLAAAAFTVAPAALAAEPVRCAHEPAAHPQRTPNRAPSSSSGGGAPRPGYVVAVRMGWAA